MISKMKNVMVMIGMLPILAVGTVVALPAISHAACDDDISVSGGAKCAKSDDQKSSINVVIKNITNVLLFIIGAVAVIMVIVGGIRYTLSGGDSSQVTAAKNTILYGVIGVIVALLAFAIVNFVVDSFSTSPADGGGGTGGRSATE